MSDGMKLKYAKECIKVQTDVAVKKHTKEKYTADKFFHYTDTSRLLSAMFPGHVNCVQWHLRFIDSQ
jgi:hypothetical protein